MRTLRDGSGMPQMGQAFAGWAKPITIIKRKQKVFDGFVTYGAPTSFDQPGSQWDLEGQSYDKIPDPITAISFSGTIQPLSPKAIALKPEGQRAWEWLQIHSFSGPLDLTTDDQIKYKLRNYKIMAVLDYSLNGYVEYHCIRDYKVKSNG